MKINKKQPFFIKALYYVGGGIALLGTIILIYQNWRDFDLFMKMFATTGFGLVLYIIALIFDREKKTEDISSPLFLISCLLIPAGLLIALDYYKFNLHNSSLQLIFSAVIAISYLASYFLIRRKVFLILSIGFFTWSFFSLSKILVVDVFSFKGNYINQYCQLLSGLAYLFIARLFSKRKDLSGASSVMYVLGTIGALSSILFMDSERYAIWHLIFPIVCGGLMWLGILARRSSVFVISAISIIPFIFKVTLEYFKEDLNWPLFIIGAGFLVMAIGYSIFSVNERYFKK